MSAGRQFGAGFDEIDAYLAFETHEKLIMGLQTPLRHDSLGHYALDYIRSVLGHRKFLVRLRPCTDLVDVGVDVALDVLPRVHKLHPALLVAGDTARQWVIFTRFHTP